MTPGYGQTVSSWWARLCSMYVSHKAVTMSWSIGFVQADPVTLHLLQWRPNSSDEHIVTEGMIQMRFAGIPDGPDNARYRIEYGSI